MKSGVPTVASSGGATRNRWEKSKSRRQVREGRGEERGVLREEEEEERGGRREEKGKKFVKMEDGADCWDTEWTVANKSEAREKAQGERRDNRDKHLVLHVRARQE